MSTNGPWSDVLPRSWLGRGNPYSSTSSSDVEPSSEPDIGSSESDATDDWD